MPLLAMGLFVLLAALWGGWIRLGWNWPRLQPTLPMSHGPLMVAGFLGTLISLERAAALRRPWTYLGPLFCALGGLALVFRLPSPIGPLLLTVGSLWLVFIFSAILKQHFAPYTAWMAAGALAFLIGNLLWLSGRQVYEIVFWWQGFLILTIAGERLELGRLKRLTPLAQRLFLAAGAIYAAGLFLSIWKLALGVRLASLGMLALAAWLLTYDIARNTIRKPGLPRFAAICLLSGYVWLAAAGVMGLAFGALPAGPRYDAMLHAVFLGFIISMIFGHAPIIFPAILGLPVRFDPLFYSHLILLHVSLLLRVGGDLLGLWDLRLWGGLLNGIAILLFLTLTFRSVIGSRKTLPTAPAR